MSALREHINFLGRYRFDLGKTLRAAPSGRWHALSRTAGPVTQCTDNDSCRFH